MQKEEELEETKGALIIDTTREEKPNGLFSLPRVAVERLFNGDQRGTRVSRIERDDVKQPIAQPAPTAPAPPIVVTSGKAQTQIEISERRAP